MDDFFVTIFTHNLPGPLVLAAIVCVLTAALVALLRAESFETSPLWRKASFVTMIIISGIGVWTAHFAAMIAYRSDALLTYDLGRTLCSAALSIGAVGIPLAWSSVQKSMFRIGLAGAASGVGIWLMHYVGMSAITECVQQNSISTNIVASTMGALAMSAAAILASRRHHVASSICFVFAVGAAHMIALSGTSITDTLSASVDTSSRDKIIFLTSLSATGLLVSFSAIVCVIRYLRERDRRHSVMLATALENMSNGILFFGTDGTLQFFNAEYLQMFGLPSGTLRPGMRTSEIVEAVGDVHGWNDARRSIAHERAERWMRTVSTSPIEFSTDTGKTIKLEVRQARDKGLVLTYVDITAERSTQQLISRMAFSDELTELPNRPKLLEKIFDMSCLDNAFELLLLDIDRFKEVNDTYGHVVGDQLLILISQRLRSFIDDDTFVARLSGDEFAVLSKGSASDNTEKAANIVRSVSQPYKIGSHLISITCSIGICSSIDAPRSGELLQHADMALYEAKRLGGTRIQRFTTNLRQAFREEVELAADIRNGMAQKQFHLVYQPVLSVKDKQVIGYEALVRWLHPTRGLISPARFIPIAERHGSIVELGRWVLGEACRVAVKLPSSTYMAINVSTVQFRSDSLIADIEDELRISGLPASRLEVELTETAMVEDGELVARSLASLRTLGVKIAMDDFGTGYSSLSHLKDFPLDRIKIDRSFVTSAATDPNAVAVLKGIVQIARDMGVATLAEGVETCDQLNLVKNIGCDAIQGYLLGRPQPMGHPPSLRICNVA